MRGRRDEIGARHRLLVVGHGARIDTKLSRQLCGKTLRTVKIPSGHTDPTQAPNACKRPRMASRLHTAPQQRQDRRILTRQEPGRQCGAGTSPDRRDRRAVEQRLRLTRLRVEGDDYSLVSRQRGALVPRKEADQLRRQRPCRRQIRRHHTQDRVTLTDVRRDAGWHRDPPRRELGKRSRERIDQLVEIEARLDLIARHHQHRSAPRSRTPRS